MFDKAYQMVKIFHKNAEQPVSEQPVKLERDRAILHKKWMAEELDEFISAKNIYEQADALTDLMYYLLGTYVEMGIQANTLESLFQIVHNSNMMKLETSEGIIKNNEGKVQKPSEWVHPDTAIQQKIDEVLYSAKKDKHC